jgi:hypothetical protein
MAAELLTITGREMFPLAPMFVHDASTSGSGKGLLLDTLSIIATGETAEVMELPADSDEQRKTVTSVLLAGKLLVAWDELHIIQGRTLAAIVLGQQPRLSPVCAGGGFGSKPRFGHLGHWGQLELMTALSFAA